MIFYHVRDPSSGANFDLYEIEYLMALKLDGIREIDEVIAEIQADYEFDISEDDFHTFMEQLSSLGFVRDLAEDGEGLDSAATQVFQVPVDNTQTQQFKIAETAALIDAGDTSHLAPKKSIPPKTIALGVSAVVGVLSLILFILYSVFGAATGVRGTFVKSSRVAVYYDSPANSVRSQRETWLSFAESGKVSEVGIKPNETVEAGTVLATLKLSAGVKKQIARAKEQVAKREEAYQKATAAVDAVYAERSKLEKSRDAADVALEKLEPGNVGKGKVSRKEMRKWRNKRAAANKGLSKLVRKERKLVQKQTRARLALDKSKGQLEVRELKIANKTLTAPFDGQVVSIEEDVEEGSRVEADQQIIHIRDPSKLEVTFEIPRFKASKQGGRGFMVVEGQATQPVTIASVGGKKDKRLVAVHFDDPGKELIHVGSKQFRLVREFREPAYRISRRALVERDGTEYIALMREGRVVWFGVEVLWKDSLMMAVETNGADEIRQSDMVLLEIRDGSPLSDLDDGDRVVLSEN